MPTNCTVGLVRGKEALDMLPDILQLAAQPCGGHELIPVIHLVLIVHRIAG